MSPARHIHSEDLYELISTNSCGNPEENEDELMRTTWNKDDRSTNSCVKSNGVIFYREPIAYYTDAIRGRLCFEKRVNVWKIKWLQHERGTHAMVGVATDQMPLQVPGYVQLVGSDKYSWGFDVVNKTLHHDGKTVNPAYPDNSPTNIGDEIIVVLDMDSGTLCFASDIGHCYGVAFSGLKGKKLFPAISSVWGQCNVAIQFLGSIASQPASLLANCRQAILNNIKSNTSLQLFKDKLPSKLIDYVNEFETLLDVSYVKEVLEF